MAENNVQDQEQIMLPDPIIFTDAASLKVKELIDEEGSESQTQSIRSGRRMLRFPVRLHF